MGNRGGQSNAHPCSKDTYILIQGTCEYVSYMSKEWTKDGQFPWRWDQGCYSADLKIER